MSNQKNKVVYIITFEEGSYLRDRLVKICSSFLEPLFEINLAEIAKELDNSERQKDETKNMIR